MQPGDTVYIKGGTNNTREDLEVKKKAKKTSQKKLLYV